ncbi:unnamed protein product [marine sediment metagenome]|uniref:Uncharacterized protein n=1 Tax=marine sediment metagenome TaxID=412755 RepID=X1TIU0_9ZZZZ
MEGLSTPGRAHPLRNLMNEKLIMLKTDRFNKAGVAQSGTALAC